MLAAVATVLLALLAVAVPWRDLAGRGSTEVRQDQPGPVLLVTGYGGGTGALDVLAAALRRAGRTATVVPAIDGGTTDLVAQARAVRDAASAALSAGAPSVDVIGYSAGGVVTRIWISQLGGAAHVRRVVTLGSPFHGTEVAELAAAALPGACPAACRQLVPGSGLLSGLAAAPPGRPWTSIWTEQDRLVVPPSSASLAGATDIDVQRVCHDAKVEHSTLPTDPLVVGLVLTALSGPAPVTAAPPPASCETLRTTGTRALSR